jgi:hypothetical protein
MRQSRSSRFDAQAHIFIDSTGILSGALRFPEDLVIFEEGGCTPSTTGPVPVTLLLWGSRDGSEDDVPIVTIINLTVVNAKNPYWRINQKVF